MRIRQLPSKKSACWLLAILAAYSVLGFIALPLILRPVLQDKINQSINGQITIEEVSINPFVLSASLNNCIVKNIAGQNLISFDQLYVNLQLRSLYEWAPTFSQISLVNPKLTIGNNSDGKSNFADLQKQSDSESNQESKVPRVIFDKIELTGGKVFYFDAQHAKSFEYELAPLKIEFVDFRTYPGSKTKFNISADNEGEISFDLDGDLEMNPLKVAGHLDLKLQKPGPLFDYLVTDLQLKSPKAQISIETDYSWDSSENSEFTLKAQKVELLALELVRFGESLPLFLADKISFGLDLSLRNNSLKITSLLVNAATSHLRKLEDGTFNLPFASKPANSESKSKSWRIEIPEAKFIDSAVSYQDFGQSKEQNLLIDQLNINFSVAPDNFKAELSCRANHSGSIKSTISGTLSPFKLDSISDIRDLPIKPIFAQFQSEFANKIKSASGSAQASIAFSAENGVAIEGDAEFKDLSLVAGEESLEVLAWEKANVNGVKFSSKSLLIDSLEFEHPRANFLINKDGLLNFASLFANKDSNHSKQAPAPFSYKIRSININSGFFSYRDKRLTPAFYMSLEEAGGKLLELSERTASPLPLKVNAKIGGQGRVNYDGQFVLNSSFPFQNGNMKLDEFAMTNLSPFTLKLFGRPVDGGKLHATLKSEAKNNSLYAENLINLDRFFLGSQTQSSTSSLPITTALSILRDGNGQIHLNIPLRGDLQSPSFEYGNIFYNALQNLILEVVASPISVIASLYNFDREELSHLDFEAESSELAQSEYQKIEIIKSALTAKPELRLEIRGAVSQADINDPTVTSLNEELIELGNKRAYATKDLVLQDSSISSDRIYVLAPSLVRPSDKNTTAIDLSLRS